MTRSNNKTIILLLATSTLLIAICNGSIPRSSSRHSQYYESSSSSSIISSSPPPLWNPSSKIDDHGFLKEYYPCIPGEWEYLDDEDYEEEEDAERAQRQQRRRRRAPYYRIPPRLVEIRQVPGDGNCLFHSIAACLSLAENKTHVDMKEVNIPTLRCISRRLRTVAVDCLSLKPRRLLFLQGDEYLRAKELVDAAASQYDLSGGVYCDLMRKDSYWGGGPEIVALCNVLRRPIYVYELVATTPSSSKNLPTTENVPRGGSGTTTATKTLKKINTHFCLRRMACFGSPKFDNKNPIHILSADSRFPDVVPGKQLTNGNHFLALFPIFEVRGGGASLNEKKKHASMMKQGSTTPTTTAVPEKDQNEHNIMILWIHKIGKLLVEKTSGWILGASF